MSQPFCNMKLARAALLAGLALVAWSELATAQSLDDPDAHCQGYNDEAVSGFGGYQQEGDHGYAVIPGFTFGCTTQDRVTGNRARVKPKFCNVNGGRFPMPSSREACHQMIDNAINNACQADVLVGEPGLEFFSSSEAVERFAGCLPIFREQAKACVAHFKLMRPRCDGGETVADQPGSDDSTQHADAPEPNCAGAQEGAECWKETANKPGCYVWDDYLQPGQTVTWPGSCPRGIADGEGTITWSSDNGPYEYSGTLSEGKLHGHAVVRYPRDGNTNEVREGPYVNGTRHGRWIERNNYTEGTTSVYGGSYVDGKRHGRWLNYRWSNDVEWVTQATFVNGENQSGYQNMMWDPSERTIRTCGEVCWTRGELSSDERFECEESYFPCSLRVSEAYDRDIAEILRRAKAELGIN